MDFARNHWKTLAGLFVVGVLLAGIGLMESPSLVEHMMTTPSPTATPIPTSLPINGTMEGQVKANTFIPTFPPTKPPVPTGGFVASGPCSKLGIDLVLDTSSSMKNPKGSPRIDSLKEAVSDFIDKIPNEAIFSAQRFDREARSVVSPVMLGDERSKVEKKIYELKAAGEGGTHTKEGLYKAKSMIEEANTMFPGREWTVILLSDGAPNPKSEEGREAANALKNMGIKIITIGLDLDEEENVSPEEAREHMRDMASSSSDFFDAQSDDLSIVYESLADKLCE
jgi:uncharacterized protein YegL